MGISRSNDTMKVFICLATLVAVASARPRFLVIPLEDLEQLPQGRFPVVQIPELSRQARAADDGYAPEPGYHQDNQPAASSGYGHGGDDHVDYGAYTGGYGAFGWYTDHPVHVHH